MQISLDATFSRPVAADCDDTVPVPVCVLCDVFLDGVTDYHDAVITEDVRNGEGLIVFHRGETIAEDQFSHDDKEQLDRAYLRRVQFDPADEAQEFPPDNVEAMPTDDYDQRNRRKAA